MRDTTNIKRRIKGLLGIILSVCVLGTMSGMNVYALTASQISIDPNSGALTMKDDGEVITASEGETILFGGGDIGFTTTGGLFRVEGAEISANAGVAYNGNDYFKDGYISAPNGYKGYSPEVTLEGNSTDVMYQGYFFGEGNPQVNFYKLKLTPKPYIVKYLDPDGGLLYMNEIAPDAAGRLSVTTIRMGENGTPAPPEGKALDYWMVEDGSRQCSPGEEFSDFTDDLVFRAVYKDESEWLPGVAIMANGRYVLKADTYTIHARKFTLGNDNCVYYGEGSRDSSFYTVSSAGTYTLTIVE